MVVGGYSAADGRPAQAGHGDQQTRVVRTEGWPTGVTRCPMNATRRREATCDGKAAGSGSEGVVLPRRCPSFFHCQSRRPSTRLGE